MIDSRMLSFFNRPQIIMLHRGGCFFMSVSMNHENIHKPWTRRLRLRACGNGLKERDVVLNIGKRVESYLQVVGYSWQTDLFVGIHCNAGGGIGTETY